MSCRRSKVYPITVICHTHDMSWTGHHDFVHRYQSYAIVYSQRLTGIRGTLAKVKGVDTLRYINAQTLYEVQVHMACSLRAYWFTSSHRSSMLPP